MAKAIPICWVDNGDAFGRRSLPWKRLSEGPLPRIWRRRLEGGALSCCGGVEADLVCRSRSTLCCACCASLLFTLVRPAQMLVSSHFAVATWSLAV